MPGYDRHFKLLENFGVEMIPMPFQDDGPDVNVISDLISKDDDISGIVCVPRHSNPTGHVYSDQNVKEIFELIANKKEILWFFGIMLMLVMISEILLTKHSDEVSR